MKSRNWNALPSRAMRGGDAVKCRPLTPVDRAFYLKHLTTILLHQLQDLAEAGVIKNRGAPLSTATLAAAWAGELLTVLENDQRRPRHARPH